MKSYASALLASLVIGVGALVVACAEGEEDDLAADVLGNQPAEAGAEPGIKIPSNPPAPQDAGASKAEPPHNADAAAPAATVNGACPAPNKCVNPTDLGVVRSDEGADVEKGTGTTSQWFKVKGREASAWFNDMLVKATLKSPPGSNFDLYVYEDPSNPCNATSQSKSTTSDDWVRTQIPGGPGTQEQTIIYEVRYVSGPCDPSATWTLTIEGNK